MPIPDQVLYGPHAKTVGAEARSNPRSRKRQSTHHGKILPTRPEPGH